MKYIILIFLFISCAKSVSTEPKLASTEVSSVIHKCPEPIIVHDTVFVPKDVTVNISYKKENDSLLSVIKKKNDSLFIERFKLERVKYYNRITIKNKSQLKFLNGWINRATK